jgi:hypothetical protein
MKRIDAGIPFDLVIVCNGGDERPLTLPGHFDDLGPRILNRENYGYNLGAWDHGWRNADNYEYYLFLQDDCILKNPGWVHEFVFRMTQDENIGLLGEMVMHDQMGWEYVRRALYHPYHEEPERWPEPVHPIDVYRDLFEKRGIPWNPCATHLPSIILFTSREILERIDGFPIFGPTYRQAVACEVAFSQLITLLGYRISKIEDIPFAKIGHRQWSSNGQPRSPELGHLIQEMKWKAKVVAKDALGLRRRMRGTRVRVPVPAPNDPTPAPPPGDELPP